MFEGIEIKQIISKDVTEIYNIVTYMEDFQKLCGIVIYKQK